MSTEADIVERLRKHVNDRGGTSLENGTWQMMLDAAAEIEDLRIAIGGVNRDWNNAIAERDAAARALTFYADPFAWKAAHDPGDDISVPDFYSETSFGDTAVEALSVIATEGDSQ